MIDKIMCSIKSMTNIHLPNKEKTNVFIFTTPRSGSTWLMDLILTQPGFKSYSDPFDIREPLVREHLIKLGITEWTDFYKNSAYPALQKYIRGFCDGQFSTKNS